MAADPTVQIDPALASAILHTSEALAGKVVVSEQVIEQRILEVLLLMAEAGAAPLRPDMKHCALTEAVRFIIRHNPAQTWEAAQVASELNTSESTLRRHLRHEGASFRQIVVEERMRAARSMLMAGRISVTEAAIVSGYASLSHFTKRFRTTYGCLPSEFLPNGAISP
jgi:AraC-like DNA-binding protein